jgi:ATP-dependent helicase HrpA
VEEGHVNLRLFHSQESARNASLEGVQRLVELAMQRDLGWLQKDLRSLARLEPLLAGFCSADELQAAAFANLRRHLLPPEPFPALSEVHFKAALEQAQRRLPGLAVQLVDRTEAILKLRAEFLRRFKSAPAPAPRSRTLSDFKQLCIQAAAPVSGPGTPAGELESLLPKKFLEATAFERLAELPRYIKALLIRADRAALNPIKDQERARQLAPYQAALRKFEAATAQSFAVRRQVEDFRWMIEEFKVSLFAQELGTAFPISAKRLDLQLEKMRL